MTSTTSSSSSSGQQQQQISRVVNDFMRQRLRSKGFDLGASSSSGSISRSLSETLQQQADALMQEYGEAMSQMVDRALCHPSHPAAAAAAESMVIDSCTSTSSLDPPLDNYQNFKLMADSMIAGNGVQWSHILTLMVFVTELAYKQSSETFVASCSDWLVRYFSSEIVSHFIASNGGWEGMIAWSEGKAATSSSSTGDGNSTSSSSSSSNGPSSPSSSSLATNGLLLGIGSAAALLFMTMR